MSKSRVTSPLPPTTSAFSPDNSTFDFLQFMGLDATTSPYSAGAPLDPGSVKNIGDDENRTASSRGRGKVRGARHSRGARSTSSGAYTATNTGMDVDANNGVVPFSPSQMLGMPKDIQGPSAHFGLNGSLHSNGQEFDASQAQLLHQQLEHIHMQSPLVFDPNNTQHSPFHPMAQMFLTSPMNGLPQLPSAYQDGTDDRDLKRRMAVMNSHGQITPGPSGEVFPQAQIEQMSPMQLEKLSRGDHNFDMTPLLSPALSTQHSVQASPAASMAFTSQNAANGTKSPLELLQEQQRQFQEQLSLLQQQQRELQATAAAVAAASVHSTSSQPGSATASPYIATTQPHRPATTPGVSGQHSAGSLNTPSPGYFSPLTSPAVDGRAFFASQQHNGYSRTPHPLSALSSPALNPVGSSGGANQTLSPALEPQSNNDMPDPEYVRALASMLDGNAAQNDSNVYSGQGNMTNHISSPLVGPSNGAGPNRHSLPPKTRPSPMMKPVNHRSHGKHSSTSGPSNFSLTTSPAIQRVVQTGLGMPGMGYLPPAAIQPQYSSGSAGGTSASALTHSTPSTPSPVDLNQLMPPPPVPANGKGKGMIPMTPASLMNLGSGNPSMLDVTEEVDTAYSTPILAPKRQGGRSSTGSSAANPKAQPKRAGTANAGRKAATSRLAPSAAGKRALAMRPAGDIGVRAATKGAAVAASLPLPEGETRKTSHKAAEQKRRDSLKAGFDELRLLLPPINTEALDPESGEPIPGSSAPRLLPKSSLVPDDNPNRGVSKVALLKFSNEYIVRLHDKVEKRDDYIERLRLEVQRLREGNAEEVRGEDGEDLLEMDMLDGEEDDFADPVEETAEGGGTGDEEDEEMNDDDDEEWTAGGRRRSGRKESRRPSLGGNKRGSGSTLKSGR